MLILFKKYKILIGIILSISVIFSSLSNTTSSMHFPIKEKYILTSSFGYRDLDNEFHNGIDCAIPKDTEVFAMSKGKVTFSGFDPSGGYMVILQYDNGYKSMYCHLSENLKVSIGDNVKTGQLVGFVGPKYLKNGRLNGYTTGVHLHFGLYFNEKSIDPLSIHYAN